MGSDEERVIREVFERWNAGERELDPSRFHPEIELHSALTNSAWRGLIGVQAWIDELLDQTAGWMFRFRDGKLDRLQTFISHSEARVVAQALEEA